MVIRTLVDTAHNFGWHLKAWVVLSNHYHLLAQSPESGAESLTQWLREFHRRSASEVNVIDGQSGRRVWMNYRETLITHQTSFLARLNYIHQNPVKHHLTATAEQYAWSSFRWFSTHASPGFVQSVSRFSNDRLVVWDDF